LDDLRPKGTGCSGKERALQTPFYWNVSRTIAALTGGYALVGGALSFIGWAADIPSFIDWWGTGIVIKANTALAIACCGIALLCLLFYPTAQILVRVLGAFVAVLGGLTLLQHIGNWDFGIDTLLFDEPPGALATAAPGRMGPPASASLFALGCALLLLTNKSHSGRLSVGLPLAVMTVSGLSLVGYWYGAEEMYTLPRATGIALQTATMLMALGIGIVAAQPTRQPMKTLCENTNAGAVARRILPIVIFVPLALGWLRVTGERMGLYEFAFGTSVRTVVEIALLGGMLWWAVRAIRVREIRQQRAEAERRQTEQQMNMVLEASAVPFSVISPVLDENHAVVDFKWEYVNAVGAAVMKRKPVELIGRKVTVTMPDVWTQRELFEHFVAVATKNEVREFEMFFNANGIQGWFHLIASPMEGGVAIWFADVSVRKQQELAMREADRRKDEFLATLAHELRNPIAPIRQAALLSGKPMVTEAQRKWANEVIERQVRHMSLLLDDLLDVSRITRGTLQLRKEETLMSALVASAVETARPLIDSKKHRLSLDLPPDDVRLNVDPLRLSQVIANLLNNAAKYTNPGGAIKLSIALKHDELTLTVTDDGIGIAQDELSTIFTMFSQVKSAQERSEGGLGIGLALTKGLVELHGGSIDVRSDGPNRGSTFIVRIPRVMLATPSEATQVTPMVRPLLSRRILVADDNRDAAESLAMLLSHDGHEVRLAHDGEQALRMLATFDADVALLDLGMPHLSGYDVAKRIRANNSDMLLIAITGWGQSSDREKSAAAGFDHHLTKPVDYDALCALLMPNAHRDTLVTTPASRFKESGK
jgi:signal transduction histidine kinase/ActR/RegA family two-component response regulator